MKKTHRANTSERFIQLINKGPRRVIDPERVGPRFFQYVFFKVRRTC